MALNQDIDPITGNVLRVGGSRVVKSASGAPTKGNFQVGDQCIDYGTPKYWVCYQAGNPGLWKGVVLA